MYFNIKWWTWQIHWIIWRLDNSVTVIKTMNGKMMLRVNDVSNARSFWFYSEFVLIFKHWNGLNTISRSPVGRKHRSHLDRSVLSRVVRVKFVPILTLSNAVGHVERARCFTSLSMKLFACRVRKKRFPMVISLNASRSKSNISRLPTWSPGQRWFFRRSVFWWQSIRFWSSYASLKRRSSKLRHENWATFSCLVSVLVICVLGHWSSDHAPSLVSSSGLVLVSVWPSVSLLSWPKPIVSHGSSTTNNA